MQGRLGWGRPTVAIGVILACGSIASLAFAWMANVLRKSLDNKLSARGRRSRDSGRLPATTSPAAPAAHPHFGPPIQSRGND
jgi:hypothetical protein